MSLRVELVAVGTELLLGQLTDTNTVYVAAQLAANGIDVLGTHAVGDNRARIAATLRSVLERVDGAITTGGLGPTVDDLTKEAVCDALGLETEVHEPSLRQMQEFFAAMGREMRENNRKQAEIPRGAHVLVNPRGTAPGFIAFGKEGKFIVAMPGVPREMKPMLSEHAIPYLRERFGLTASITTRVLHTINLGESEIDHRIADLFRASENPKIAVLAHEGQCDVKIMAKADSAAQAQAMIAPLEREIASRLKGFVYARDHEPIAAVIVRLLIERGATLGIAESCTGGRIAAAVTAVPGASAAFRGGIVAYENAVKVTALGVSQATLDEAGSVSERTVLEMARGARERLGSTIGISTSGIAGPAGGTAEKPVGLVCFAFDDGVQTRSWSLTFRGDRDAIQRRASVMMLGLLWRELLR